MSRWKYFGPAGRPARITDLGWDVLTDPRETVGPAQLQLLLLARRSSGVTVVLTHDRRHNRKRMAARRLVERGLLAGPNFRGTQRITNYRGQEIVGARAGIYVYTLTERGRMCWLRTRGDMP